MNPDSMTFADPYTPSALSRAWARFCRWVMPRKPCNLERHAESELRIAGLFDNDSDYGGALGPAIMQVVRAFSDEGHSGGSASISISAISKLLSFEPLTPLAGDESEWNDVGAYSAGPCWQNNRCSHVFKGEDGRAYDIDGKVFREPNGACYTNIDSRVYITFPYTPVTEYIDVGPGKTLGGE